MEAHTFGASIVQMMAGTAASFRLALDEFLGHMAPARWALPGHVDIAMFAKNIHGYFRDILWNDVLGAICAMLWRPRVE